MKGLGLDRLGLGKLGIGTEEGVEKKSAVHTTRYKKEIRRREGLSRMLMAAPNVYITKNWSDKKSSESRKILSPIKRLRKRVHPYGTDEVSVGLGKGPLGDTHLGR